MFLHNSIKKVKNKNAPMKETSSKEAKISKKIWITSAIRKSIKPKNSLLKTFLKNKVFTFIDINTIRKNRIALFGIVRTNHYVYTNLYIYTNLLYIHQ